MTEHKLTENNNNKHTKKLTINKQIKIKKNYITQKKEMKNYLFNLNAIFNI